MQGILTIKTSSCSLAAGNVGDDKAECALTERRRRRRDPDPAQVQGTALLWVGRHYFRDMEFGGF